MSLTGRIAPFIACAALPWTLVMSGCDDADSNYRTYSEVDGLGAPCVDSDDCAGELSCTSEIQPDSDYHYCFEPCGPAVGSCGEGAFCAARVVVASDPLATEPMIQVVHICERECSSDAECREIHPDATGCLNYSGNPPERLSCGIAG